MKSPTDSRLRNRILIIPLVFLLSLQSLAQTSNSTSLDELIRLANERSDSFKAIDTAIQSLEAEIKARDLELSATLSADYSDTKDNRATLSNRTSGDSRLLETTLAKPFSTGTNVSLLLSHEIADLTTTAGQRDIANWEISLSQDLWRNSFGRSTRLRQKSDSAEYKSRKFDAYNQRQQLLINLEKIYWDLSLALKEEEIRQANIERSENLEKWIRERVRKFAAENTDLLQIQALVSQRKLDLLEARNRISDLRVQVQQLIPNMDASQFRPDLKSLETERNPRSLLALPAANRMETPWSLTALSSRYRYDQAQLDAERRTDSLRPTLQAYVSHGRNGIDTAFTPAWQTAQSDEFTATTYGLRLSMELDGDMKDQSRRAAQLAAEARSLQAQVDSRKSELTWLELERQIQNLKSQTEEARRLSKFQSQKSTEERKRYTQGRTTAFQAITFELDAASAELRFYQLLSNLRKLESLARAYAAQEEGSL